MALGKNGIFFSFDAKLTLAFAPSRHYSYLKGLSHSLTLLTIALRLSVNAFSLLH
jgi:hypothetical protein